MMYLKVFLTEFIKYEQIITINVTNKILSNPYICSINFKLE